VTKVVLPRTASCPVCLPSALDIEQVVGDLEGLSERAAEIVERQIFLLQGLAEDCPGDAAKAQQGPGFHLLQSRHIDRLAIAEAPFAGQIQHLPTRHAADAGGARQRTGQGQPHGRLAMNFVAGDDVESNRKQRVAREDCGRIIVSFVQGRPAAAQVAVVHRRQIVMDQRITVDAFERGARKQGGLAGDSEHGRAFHNQKGTQALSSA
jgi:hypothetical protein